MNKNKTTKSLIFIPVLLLTLIMLLPTIVQFAHVFEKHEQIDCNEVTTHIHEHELECTTCDFQISSFNFSIEYPNIDLIAINHSVYTDYYKSNKHNSLKQSFSLRGPPLF